jgi:methionyl aminopeptidase
MAVHIKTREQIEKMRIAGEILAKLDEVLTKEIKPDVTTKQLDSIAEKFIRSQGAIPSFKGYGGFPGSICTSVNDEIVHGIPSERKLKQGDIRYGKLYRWLSCRCSKNICSRRNYTRTSKTD